MSSNRPSLADAFAPVAPASNRGAKLEGILAPKRRSAEENPATEPVAAPILTHIPVSDGSGPAPELEPRIMVEQAATEPSSAAPEEGHAARPKATAKRTATRPKASAAVPGAPRNVGVYLAPQLLADVKDAVHLERITYADLLIDAFEAVDDAVITREFAPETILSKSGMPRRAVRRRGSAGIQIQVRLDDDQIAWLDEKVIEFGAPSRSALVSAVYKLHVTTK